MADVFISYSKARSREAGELAAELRDLGYDVWWDPNLLPTGAYTDEIDRQLNAAHGVIVIWSPESVKSKWVRSEAAHADRQEKLLNTHTPDIGDPSINIPKPFDQINSVAIDSIRLIVAALGHLNVARSGAPGTPVVAVPAVAEADGDDRLFAEVESVGTPEALEFYLGEFPEGRHAGVVRFRLRAREPEVEPAAKPSISVSGNVFDNPVVSINQSALRNGRRATLDKDGWVRIDVQQTNGVADKRFRPGAGETEWFQDDNSAAPEMVVVPAGSYTMGSPVNEPGRKTDEGQRHDVTIARPFAVSRFPIDAYTHCLSEGGTARPSHTQLPASNSVAPITWDQAQEFVQWLSEQTKAPYRLLTEAEWEYVARAGTKAPFWWGEAADYERAQYGWFDPYDGDVRLPEHISYDDMDVSYILDQPPEYGGSNAWGLFGILGRVFEWVEDDYHRNYNDAPTDGSAWKSNDRSTKVARGGSYFSAPGEIRCASRAPFRRDLVGEAAVQTQFLGIRVARDLV